MCAVTSYEVQSYFKMKQLVCACCASREESVEHLKQNIYRHIISDLIIINWDRIIYSLKHSSDLDGADVAPDKWWLL